MNSQVHFGNLIALLTLENYSLVLAMNFPAPLEGETPKVVKGFKFEKTLFTIFLEDGSFLKFSLDGYELFASHDKEHIVFVENSCNEVDAEVVFSLKPKKLSEFF